MNAITEMNAWAMLPFTTALQALGGLAILCGCFLRLHAMGPGTRHCFRFVCVLMGVAGLALVTVPFIKWADRLWVVPLAHVDLVLCIAVYLLIDRRWNAIKGKP